MKLKRIIASQKVITDEGIWKSGVKMPKSIFPLSKSHSFKVPQSFNWRLVCFECLGEKFRLLIYYRYDISSYSATLGHDVGGDMLVMARLEFHGTHPGWHMHAVCDSTGRVPGRTGADIRFPDANSFHKDLIFGVVDDSTAYKTAIKAFKLIDPLQDLFGMTDYGH